MKIDDKYIERLREGGLFVAKPMPSTHVFPDGVLIGKPKSVPGNAIPDFSTGFVIDIAKDKEIEFDAPPVWLFGHCGVWVVQAQEYSPVPGPGDFQNEWSSPEEAVEDILDFYFGDPERMHTKAEARKHPVRRSESDSDKAASA